MNHEHRVYTYVDRNTEAKKFEATIKAALVEINEVVLQAFLKQELIREAVAPNSQPTVTISLQEGEGKQLVVVAEWGVLGLDDLRELCQAGRPGPEKDEAAEGWGLGYKVGPLPDGPSVVHSFDGCQTAMDCEECAGSCGKR